MLTLLVIATLAAADAGPEVSPAGTWEGESKCTVAGSPCHDEHVIYEFKATASGFTLDGYKVVGGEKQSIGTLECKPPRAGRLSCAIPKSRQVNDWAFTFDERVMDGTLYAGQERQLYRRIHVSRR